MSRIDSLGEAASYHIPDKKKTQKKEKAKSRSFSRLVEEAEGAEAPSEELEEPQERRAVEELLDGVFAAGDQLKKLPTLETVKDYRRKVKAFVKYVVSRTVALRETASGANILRRKRFTLVEVIDKRLESLALSVFSAQREQIAILAQVDEINGLLIDLVS
jgi:uncharacterized protein YaaR (DUF327 family)